MEFTKSVMKLSELEQMGFEHTYLISLTKEPHQDFAWKMSKSKNSPFLFDTAKFQKFIDKQIKNQRSAIR